MAAGAGCAAAVVSRLARLVARERYAATQRLWETLYAALTDQQRRDLDGLLLVAPGERVSALERWRTGPVRASGPQMVKALHRVTEIIGSGLSRAAGRTGPGGGKDDVLTSLGLPEAPDELLATHVTTLDEALRYVAGRLDANTDVRVDEAGKIHVTNHKAVEEPPSLIDLRNRVAAMLPRVDIGEVIWR